jgi:hypothetical protein
MLMTAWQPSQAVTPAAASRTNGSSVLVATRMPA